MEEENQDDAVKRAFEQLIRHLGVRRFCRLPELIEIIEQDTGYGDVKIVIADRRVRRLKREISED